GDQILLLQRLCDGCAVGAAFNHERRILRRWAGPSHGAVKECDGEQSRCAGGDQSPENKRAKPAAAAARFKPSHQSTAVRITAALVPPNPNEFDIAAFTGRFFAFSGVKSMADSTDGFSRLSVGGTTPSRIAK